MPNLGDTITYNAGYSPGGATLPISYSWGITPSNAGTINGSSVGSSVSITWNTLGTHTVDLSTSNCSGTVTSSASVVVSNSYNKCNNVLSWNTPTATCNGNNTTTITISVNGNNGEAVEFSVNGGTYIAATSNNNTYVYTHTSDGSTIGFDARIVGCSTSINGNVNTCTSGGGGCVNVSSATISGSNTSVIPTTQTRVYSVSYDGDAPHTLSWSIISPSAVVTTLGSSTTQSVTFTNCGSWSVACAVTNCSGHTVTTSYGVTVSLANVAAPVSSVCRNSSQAVFSTTGRYPGGILKLYETTAGGTIISFIDSIEADSITLDPFTLNAHYGIKQEICGQESGINNIVTTDLNMPVC